MVLMMAYLIGVAAYSLLHSPEAFTLELPRESHTF